MWPWDSFCLVIFVGAGLLLDWQKSLAYTKAVLVSVGKSVAWCKLNTEPGSTVYGAMLAQV